MPRRTVDPSRLFWNRKHFASLVATNCKTFISPPRPNKASEPPLLTKVMVKPVGQHATPAPVDLHLVEPDELTDDQITTFYQIVTRGKESENNDASMPSWEDPVSVFFSVTKPEIETILYIKRLVRYAQCSRAAFVVGLVYLVRLEEANPKLAITPYNMHRLLITAIMLAAKNLDDRCYSNTHYARVGGIATVREVNRLELQMLALLRFNIFVSPEEYEYFVNSFKQGKVPVPSRRVARIHTVFPTEARRSAAVGQPSLVSQKNTCAQHPSSASSGGDEFCDRVSEKRRVYRFNAPTEEFIVLPIADDP